jgi:deoxyribodipyrimidine photo-lyase
MDTTRVRKLNNEGSLYGPVLYVMERDMRVGDNHALLYARECAEQANAPLIVLYPVTNEALGTSSRHILFALSTLNELYRRCKEKNISFIARSGTSTKSIIEECVKEFLIGRVVVDFSPLRHLREWREKIAKKLKITVEEVDTHNIVPVWIASPKAEIGARTLRPKLFRKLRDYVCEPAVVSRVSQSLSHYCPPPALEELLQSLTIDHSTSVVSLAGGESPAHRVMHEFVENRLSLYATERNDANANAQSGLSAYLHFGMVSSLRVVLTVMETLSQDIHALTNEKKNSAVITAGSSSLTGAQAFLEELIVRKELSDNFCFYTPLYDSVEGFPQWAIRSLDSHKKDKREFLYQKEHFEFAVTHDDLWNAAQRELLKTGTIHGYMRMYWAKKILEWTKSAKEALAISIYLNDKYSIDGRDPNGYAGVAWSIGGVHDRAWFNRPVFGLVRYMARSGCEKHFDVDKYIRRFGHKSIDQGSMAL